MTQLLVARRGFPPRLRLKQRREFLRVQRGGTKHHVRHFMVFVSSRLSTAGTDTDEPLPTRLGITVTRKVGNAVTRNRIKRLVREVFRVHRMRLPQGLDMVWVAKQQAAAATYAEVLHDFEALLGRRAQLVGQAQGRSRRRRPEPKPKR